MMGYNPYTDRFIGTGNTSMQRNASNALNVLGALDEERT